MPNDRTTYEHGNSRTSAKHADFQRLTASDIDRKMREQLMRIQRSMTKTQAWYLNARAQKGLDKGLPRYILSDHRFKDYKFPVSWFAPRPRGFRVVREGRIRPWQFVAFHCFGEYYDRVRLKAHRGMISLPTDEHGHNPSRFLSAVWYLTLWDRGKKSVSVHFFISRRGDFISSVDLNDIAHATGGSMKLPFGMNTHSIGFEMESHLARHIHGTTKTTRRLYRQPYSDKQIFCLAVALRKIHSWRPVIKIEWRSNRAEIVDAYQKKAGGCVQHRTIHPVRRLPNGKTVGRTDPGGQFNIPQGTRADFGSPMWEGTGSSRSGPGISMESGWSQLDRVFQQIRAVNPATETFKAPLTPAALALAKASEIVNLAAHVGQKAAAHSGRNRLAALTRSQSMQTQSRRTLYANAAANNASLSALLGKANAITSAIIRRFDTSTVVGIEDAVMFDERTGLWEDGGA